MIKDLLLPPRVRHSQDSGEGGRGIDGAFYDHPSLSEGCGIRYGGHQLSCSDEDEMIETFIVTTASEGQA
jgi:hypothetical protein